MAIYYQTQKTQRVIIFSGVVGPSPFNRSFILNWSGRLVSAELFVQTTECSSILGEKRCQILRVIFNGSEVFQGRQYSVVTDVTSLVAKGTNWITVHFDMGEVICFPWEGCTYLTAYLTLTIEEGEITDYQPVEPPPAWSEIVTPILLILGIGIGAYILINIVRAGALTRVKEKIFG